MTGTLSQCLLCRVVCSQTLRESSPPSPSLSPFLQKGFLELFFCAASCASPPALMPCSWEAAVASMVEHWCICCHFIVPLHLPLLLFLWPDVHQQSVSYRLTPADCKRILLFNGAACAGTVHPLRVIKTLPLGVQMKLIEFSELFRSESLKISWRVLQALQLHCSEHGRWLFTHCCSDCAAKRQWAALSVQTGRERAGK